MPSRALRLAGATAALVFVLVLSSAARAVTVYEKDDFKIKLSGHFQTLTSSSKDPYYDLGIVMTPLGPMPEPIEGHVTNNTARARATIRVLTGTAVSGEISVDGTYTFGSALDSLSFKLGKDMPPPTYWNLEHEYIDESGRYGKLSVYRALLTIEAAKYRLVFGRQRLAYGTALFWSPIDIWNPVSPLALEPEEKVGVDGVSGIWWISDTMSATALAAVADDWDQARVAASYSFQVKSYTFDFLLGKRGLDYVGGMDFVGYLGGAGVRGEFTWTAADKADDYARAVIGIDYAFPNSLYVAAEYYHNGGPLKIDPRDPFAVLFEATGVDTLNRNFAGVLASYDLDSLLKGSLSVIYDFDKGSYAWAPGLSWSASGNLSINGGGQFFGGACDGEFGSYGDLGWLRVRWDF